MQLDQYMYPPPPPPTIHTHTPLANNLIFFNLHMMKCVKNYAYSIYASVYRLCFLSIPCILIGSTVNVLNYFFVLLCFGSGCHFCCHLLFGSFHDFLSPQRFFLVPQQHSFQFFPKVHFPEKNKSYFLHIWHNGTDRASKKEL